MGETPVPRWLDAQRDSSSLAQRGDAQAYQDLTPGATAPAPSKSQRGPNPTANQTSTAGNTMTLTTVSIVSKSHRGLALNEYAAQSHEATKFALRRSEVPISKQRLSRC